jgi:hypothetical protein
MIAAPRSRDRVQVVALLVAAAANALVGVWALANPRGFYDSFPGFGQHWVSADGPYNEHLLTDVALLSLALTFLLLAAAWKRDRFLVRVASIAALIFAAPHLLFHATHLHHFSTGDATLELVALSITVLAPLVALITTTGRSATGAR